MAQLKSQNNELLKIGFEKNTQIKYDENSDEKLIERYKNCEIKIDIHTILFELKEQIKSSQKSKLLEYLIDYVENVHNDFKNKLQTTLDISNNFMNKNQKLNSQISELTDCLDAEQC